MFIRNPFSSILNLPRKCALVLLSVLISFVLTSVSHGVSRFCSSSAEKELPVSFEAGNIWFYDREMTKIVPALDPTWITVVFRPHLSAEGAHTVVQAGKDTSLADTARAIAATYPDVTDVFFDSNLADDACFFRLRDGTDEKGVFELVAALNTHDAVCYCHPTIVIRDKTYAYFNACTIEWKTDVSEAVKERLMSEAGVSFESNDSVYRVNIFQAPFFTSLNLLAQDIHVLRAAPYLVELRPSFRAELTLPIRGGNVGDAIPFVLEITFSSLVSIDPSSLATINLKPVDLQSELFEVKFEPYDYTEVVSKSPIQIRGWMKFYTPGEFTIPPVAIRFSCSTCSDNQVRSTTTKDIRFKVSSILPSQEAERQLIVPQDPITLHESTEGSHEKGTMHLLLALASFSVALVGIGWFLKKVVSIRRTMGPVLEKSTEELLAERVETLLAEEPWGPHWQYMAEVGRALREFVLIRYHVESFPRGGSGEVFVEAVKSQLPSPCISLLRDLFKVIDDVVALEAHTYQHLDDFRSRVQEILRFDRS